MISPHPQTAAGTAAAIKGYKIQIKHFEKRIEEARAAIARLTAAAPPQKRENTDATTYNEGGQS